VAATVGVRVRVRVGLRGRARVRARLRLRVNLDGDLGGGNGLFLGPLQRGSELRHAWLGVRLGLGVRGER
jgi:hypothetical protein